MVWKGKQASKVERREAFNRALVSQEAFSVTELPRKGDRNPHSASVLLAFQGYIKAKNYPSSTSVEVMAEGGESAMFKQLFQSWREKGQTQGLGTSYSVGRIGTTKCVHVQHFTRDADDMN